jgi:hypothetical protein
MPPVNTKSIPPKAAESDPSSRTAAVRGPNHHVEKHSGVDLRHTTFPSANHRQGRHKFPLIPEWVRLEDSSGIRGDRSHSRVLVTSTGQLCQSQTTTTPPPFAQSVDRSLPNGGFQTRPIKIADDDCRPHGPVNMSMTMEETRVRRIQLSPLLMTVEATAGSSRIAECVRDRTLLQRQ